VRNIGVVMMAERIRRRPASRKRAKKRRRRGKKKNFKKTSRGPPGALGRLVRSVGPAEKEGWTEVRRLCSMFDIVFPLEKGLRTGGKGGRVPVGEKIRIDGSKNRQASSLRKEDAVPQTDENW